MKPSVFLGKDLAVRTGVFFFALLLGQSAVLGQGETPENDIMNKPQGTAWLRQPYDMNKVASPARLPTPGSLLPHAGDYVSSERNYYEIVYMPLQTRIYVYNKKFNPVSAREVHAQMTLRLPAEAVDRTAPFQFVPQGDRAAEQDYLAANFDIRALEDREACITIQVSGAKGAAGETFTPYYDHFKIRPYLAQALLTEADRDAIARQRTCPVTGAVLGSRGPVVKLYVAEFPLYVSGTDCIAAVNQAPQKFVPQAPPPPNPGRK